MDQHTVRADPITAARTPRTLMIGLNQGFLGAIEGVVSPASIVVLEERDVFSARRFAPQVESLSCVEAILLAPYQQSGDFIATVRRAHERAPFDAVLPGLEYGVPAAATAAEELGLRGANVPAAATLCDKLRLREVTARGGVRNPEWREISGAQDIRSFAQGGPVVVKPANRAGSVGVSLLDDPEDADAVWCDMVSATEGARVANRRMCRRHLVERRLVGDEYSVEALVRDGHVLFENVTKKVVAPGRHPVETGHVVPAPLPPPAREALTSAMARLIAATGFVDGVLHAEWMLTGDDPGLIECAGRPAGDRIFDLIERAYGFNLYLALIELLAGREVLLPAVPRQAAAIKFLVATPGRVAAIRGVDEVRAQAGVKDVAVSVREGTEVAPLQSSWNRCGYVLVEAPTADQAAADAERLAASIVIDTAA